MSRMSRVAVGSPITVRPEFKTAKQAAPRPDEVLRELFELLEEYGPSWYTEEHHTRALAALSSVKPTTFTCH